MPYPQSLHESNLLCCMHVTMSRAMSAYMSCSSKYGSCFEGIATPLGLTIDTLQGEA
jgi:hypothetical protein